MGQSLLQMSDDKVRSAIAREPKGHVWQALASPHANHVLQACIILLRPKDMQFVFDELHSKLRGPTLASQHKYGCRIIKRLLECGSKAQVTGLAEALLTDLRAVSTHP